MHSKKMIFPAIVLLTFLSYTMLFSGEPVDTFTITSLADSYVRAGKYADLNYGSEEIIETKLPPKESHEMEIYLQFDLSGITKVVKEATLRLYIKNGTNHAGMVYYVSDDTWQEHSITYNNKPAFQQRVGNWVWQKEYVDVELSDLIADEISAEGILSLRVVAVTTGKTYKYYSKEYSDPEKWPRITVTCYNPPEAHINVSPPVIQRGGSARLTWQTALADTITIDQGIGEVEPAGTMVVGPGPTGTYTYTITATGNGGTVTDSTTLTVLNTPPTVYDLTVTLDEDSRVLVELQADDLNGDELTFRLAGLPENGTASLTGNTVEYIPPANYFGYDSFTYTAHDGEAASSIATVTLVIRPVNDPPQLTPIDDIVMNEGETVCIGVTASDIDGDILTLTAINIPGFGTFTDNGDATGMITFSPGFSGSGTYSLLVLVSDGLLEDSDDFSLIVNDFTIPPVLARGDDIVGTEGENVALVNTSFTYVNDVEDLSAMVDWGDGTEPRPALVSVANSSGTIDASHIYGDNDDYIVSITLTGSESGDITETITARIQNGNPVIDRENNNDLTIDAGLSYITLFDFTDPGTSDTHTAVVDWGDGLTTEGVITEENGAGTLSASHIYTVDGTYTIKVTLTDDDGGSDEYEYTLTVIRSGTGRTYTLNSDFEEGDLININIADDELKLDDEVQAFHFIWVAVSSKGTVVKIDTRTGEVLGEYYTSPSGQPKNPSRTTVDHNGNVWLGNRDGNSVVCIGLYENGQWIDKNGDGICQTSVGLGNVLPWTNAGGADTYGGVSTAADECILYYVRTSSGGTRHVSVNSENDIWVSGTDNRIFDLIDGTTGQIIRTEPSVGYGGYGGLIDKNGVVWSASPLLRWDTSKPLTGPNGGNWRGYEHDSYGLGIDSQGNVWNVQHTGYTIHKFNPSGNEIGRYSHGDYFAQGVVVDKRDHVWVAHSLYRNTVGHLLNDGTYIGNIYVGSGPTGVAVDGDGKIWATLYNDGRVVRIDPDRGPIGADGVTPIGEVDFVSPYLGGNLYNYSDMTGSTLTGAPEQGTWSVIFDSDIAGAEWGKISWNGRRYSDGAVTVIAAVSEDGISFGAPVVVANSEQLAINTGRFIKINVTFTRASTGESPVLYDIRVGTKGYGGEDVENTEPFVEAGEDSTISLTDSDNTDLTALVYDDLLPDGSHLTMEWALVSGPAEAAISRPDSPHTNVAFTTDGVYVFKITAADSFFTVDDTVTVTVLPENNPPVITSVPVTTGSEGLAYTYPVTAEDVDGDLLSFSLLTFPGGMTIGSESGVIRWTPEADESGVYEITVLVTDDRGASRMQVYTLTIEDTINLDPSITTSPETTGSEGTQYLYDVDAFDGDNDTLTFVLESAPGTMTIDSVSGLISWIPGNGDNGSYTVVVSVIDGRGGSDTQEYTLIIEDTLNNAPIITSAAPLQAQVDVVYHYDVEARDENGDTLTYNLLESPGGMTIESATGVITWTPTASDVGLHDVTIVVDDGRGGQAGQPYSLAVNDQPNHPPAITSTPVYTTREGMAYIYQVHAFDEDGDILTYSLSQAPPGMAMDSSTGLIEWIPGPEQGGESFAVTVKAVDNRGGWAEQTYTLTVSRNRAPVITSTPPLKAEPDTLYRYTVMATDPDGDPITWHLLTGPGGMTIDSTTGVVEWTPSAEHLGDHGITVEARDNFGGADNQGFTISMEESPPQQDITRPTVTLTSSGNNVLVGSTLVLTVTAADDVGVVSQTLVVAGTELPLDQAGRALFSPAQAGVYTAIATAYDAAGNKGSDSLDLTFFAQGSSTPPVALISTPAEFTEIKVPTEITGTVTDDNLLYYTLEYSYIDEDLYTEFARGTAPVAGGTLGTIDTTLMKNGLYDIRLTAVDLNGRQVTDETVYLVTGNMKIGIFTLTFTDLSIPVAGIPITVTRTYDSRDRMREGDFGYGWTMGIDTIKVQESCVPGEYWQQRQEGGTMLDPVSRFYLEETKQHSVILTYADGTVEKFRMNVDPAFQRIDRIREVNVFYTAMPGTYSTLEALDVGTQTVYGSVGPAWLGDQDGNEYNPSRYRLTTKEGTEVIIHQHNGIEEMKDRNGNTLTFTENGIIHSAGKSVLYNRDTEGRIISINDLLGNSIQYTYDSYGDLVKVTDREENVTGFVYDEKHYLEDIIDPRGVQAARNTYDDTGRLVATTDARGNTIELTHDIDARMEVTRNRLGYQTFYYYDDDGNVIKVTNHLVYSKEYTYDNRGNRLSESDEMGNVRKFTYDSRDNLLTETDPLGNVTEYTYNNYDQLLTRKDPMGYMTTWVYDGDGNQTHLTDGEGHTTTFSYNTQGLLLSTVNALGDTEFHEYDASGNRTGDTDALGNKTTRMYDANGNETSEEKSVTTINGAELVRLQYEYGRNDDISGGIDPDGKIIETVYNAAEGNSIFIDKNGTRLTQVCDENGDVMETVYADGTEESNKYNAERQLLESTDRMGRITTHIYDELGRNNETIYPDGASVKTVYDPAGRVLKFIDAKGNETSYTYDAAGNKTSAIDPEGNTTFFEYNKNGKLTARTDANRNKTTYLYDGNSRLIRTIYPDGTVTAIEYDAIGRKVAETDQSGLTTRFEYDKAGRLVRVIDATNNGTIYTYDEAGNQVSQTDANGNITRFYYDRSGNRVKRVLSLDMEETMVYDNNGNMTAKTDFNGATTTFEYDINNKLVKKIFTDETFYSYTYTAAGKRKTAEDANGITSYTYDVRDRLIRQENPDGSFISYSYDLNGNQTSVTVPSGTTTYRYDRLNRLISVTDPDGKITHYGYDAAGNRISVSYPNNTVANYTYDGLNRLTSLVNMESDGRIISSYSYALNPDGTRANVLEDTGRREVYYTYDLLKRLVEEKIIRESGGEQVFTYTYDAVGNRLLKNENGTVTNYTYDTNNRLLSENGTVYSYDDNGNRLSMTGSDEAAQYSYDYENRLVKALLTKEGVTTVVEYTYDADGNRTSRSVDGTGQTVYLVDSSKPLAQVLEDRDGSGVLNTSYIYGDDLIKQNQMGTDAYYHYDGLGSTRVLTDENGEVIDRYTFEAFGTLMVREGATENNYLFTGEQYDPNIGFYYMRARYLDPANSQFITMDTYEGFSYDPASLHKYVYVHNDPVNYIDPSGYLENYQTVLASGTIISTLSAIYVTHTYGIYRGVKTFSYGITATIILTHTVALKGPIDFWKCVGAGVGRVAIDGAGLLSNPNLTGALAVEVIIKAFSKGVMAFALTQGKIITNGGLSITIITLFSEIYDLYVKLIDYHFGEGKPVTRIDIFNVIYKPTKVFMIGLGVNETIASAGVEKVVGIIAISRIWNAMEGLLAIVKELNNWYW